jgi:hypothetical protein
LCYAGPYKRSIVRFSLLLFPKETRVHAFATGAPVSSDRTRAPLGWAPAHATLLEDLETGDYFAAQAA